MRRYSVLLFIIGSLCITSFYFSKQNRTWTKFIGKFKRTIFTKQQLLLDRNQVRLTRLYEKYGALINLTTFQTNNSTDKTLIYSCHAGCGGWGDRVRSIVFVYVLALLTQRRFMIDMNSSCEIFKVIEHNLVNWTYDKYVESKNRTRLVIKTFTFKSRETLSHNMWMNTINSENFIQAWSPYDDIWISTNFHFVTYVLRNKLIANETRKLLGRLSLSEATMESLFALLFEFLFKPSLAVRKQVDLILKASYRRHFICLHVRIGRNPTMPNDTPHPLKVNTTERMLQFVDDNLLDQPSPFVFIASDSAKAVSDVLHHYPTSSMTNVGPIIHIDQIDKRSPTACDGFIKAIADFYILGECQTSVLSSSGFSHWANLRREEPSKQLHIFNEKSNSIS